MAGRKRRVRLAREELLWDVVHRKEIEDNSDHLLVDVIPDWARGGGEKRTLEVEMVDNNSVTNAHFLSEIREDRDELGRRAGVLDGDKSIAEMRNNVKLNWTIAAEMRTNLANRQDSLDLAHRHHS
jgi:hypothetical protein